MCADAMASKTAGFTAMTCCFVLRKEISELSYGISDRRD
jgi:hypothetical protein